MTEMTGTAQRAESNFARAWNSLTYPLRAAWITTEGLLGETLQEVKASPMTWTAILALAGCVSIMAKSYHVGTVFISAVGVLWMWQDMLEEAATSAGNSALTVAA
jgi:hypothetical protein